MRLLTLEELERQYRRDYSSDRMPGRGLGRDALGEAGERRMADGLRSQCGEPILSRPGNATTCLLHRGYVGPPSRQELVAFIGEYEPFTKSHWAALAAMDEEVVA